MPTCHASSTSQVRNIQPDVFQPVTTLASATHRSSKQGSRNTNTCMHTQTHAHTDTQTHRHTDTQTHRHTDTILPCMCTYSPTSCHGFWPTNRNTKSRHQGRTDRYKGWVALLAVLPNIFPLKSDTFFSTPTHPLINRFMDLKKQRVLKKRLPEVNQGNCKSCVIDSYILVPSSSHTSN